MKDRMAIYAAMLAVLLLGAAQGFAVDPDNSERNKGDDRSSAITAETQSTDSRAEDITRRIRKSVMDQEGFSTDAKNVKIITDERGIVTLRGPVNSESERSTIERLASDIAGAGKVQNRLEVDKRDS